jgi:hypothetical protein
MPWIDRALNSSNVNSRGLPGPVAALRCGRQIPGSVSTLRRTSKSRSFLTCLQLAEAALHPATMAPNMSLHSVLAVLILSTDTPPDNSRLFAKYYNAPHTSLTTQIPTQPYKTVKDQKGFEKGLLEKTSKQTSDVILYDNKIIVFKMESDVMLYVVGNVDENEILLYNVVLALRDSLSILLK